MSADDMRADRQPLAAASGGAGLFCQAGRCIVVCIIIPVIPTGAHAAFKQLPRYAGRQDPATNGCASWETSGDMGSGKHGH